MGFNTISVKMAAFLFLAVKKLAHVGNLGTFNMLFPKIYLQDPEIFSFVLFISGLKPKIPGLIGESEFEQFRTTLTLSVLFRNQICLISHVLGTNL